MKNTLLLLAISFAFTANIFAAEQAPRQTTEHSFNSAFDIEKPPVCMNLAQVKGFIEYPVSALEEGLEGIVIVKVLVGAEGNVITVGAVTGPGIFADEVRSKSALLEFKPGIHNGRPVRVWVSVPFVFRLKNPE